MATQRADRRLVAILAADIVGYSRLVERDEAGTLGTIKALRETAIDPLLTEHRGRIVKLMGDGAIVEFGSVVDAVACAVALQKAVAAAQDGVPADRRIVFRIGVNLGDVVVEGDDLLGDGVNVAARLEQLCEPGGVLVSGTAYDQLQGKLGLPLEFTGEQRVKNIERPVRAYRVRLDGKPARWPIVRLPRRAVVGVLLLAPILAGLAGWWLWPVSPALNDGVPSIAVLRFQNVTDDASLDVFTEGLRADILRGMSATRVFAVLSGGGASVEASNSERLDGDIGATYLVEGTVQADGPTLHVTPRLVDAANGRLLWSDGFERPLAEANSARAEIGRRIANALIVVPAGAAFRAAADAARAKSPASLTANDCVILSVQERFRWTKEGNARALDLAQRAVELDPRSAAAQLQVAFAWQHRLTKGWAQSREDALTRWLEAASAAVTLDPSYAYARVSLGQRYNLGLNPTRAEEEFERAVELAPGNAEVLSSVGVELAFLGRADRAVELTQHAARMDPDNDYRAATSKALFLAGRYVEAAAEIEEITDPDDEDRAFAMLAYAQLGRADAAQRWKERLGARQIDYIFENWAATFGDFAPSAAAQRQIWLDGLRKLDIPICATPEQLIELKIKPLAECETKRAKHQAAAP